MGSASADSLLWRPPRRRSDLVNQTVSSAAVGTSPDPNCTDLLHSALRSDVLGVNEEHDAAHEPEGVAKHEPFHLAVVGTAPMRPREERPTDLDLASASVIAAKARRADDTTLRRSIATSAPPEARCSLKNSRKNSFP
jgi:hypothetical protein